MFNVVMSKRVLSKKSSVYWARMVTPAPAVNFWLRAWRQVIDEMLYTFRLLAFPILPLELIFSVETLALSAVFTFLTVLARGTERAVVAFEW